jgi:hypothetical protein
MPIRSLAEVGARLEEAVSGLPGEPADASDHYDRYEQVAIAILDSEHSDFIPGELQEYLETVLYKKRLELGLIPFPDPREE